MKLQSAIEYLTTYGWAILIIAISLVVLFQLVGGTLTPTAQCTLPAGFSCLSYFLSQNGMLQMNILQSTQYPVTITAVGCNYQQTLGQMDYPANQPYFSAAANVPIGSNYTFRVRCYTSGGANTIYSGKVGGVYSGYVIINYTNAYTSFPNTIYGTITAKVSN